MPLAGLGSAIHVGPQAEAAPFEDVDARDELGHRDFFEFGICEPGGTLLAKINRTTVGQARLCRIGGDTI